MAAETAVFARVCERVARAVAQLIAELRGPSVALVSVAVLTAAVVTAFPAAAAEGGAREGGTQAGREVFEADCAMCHGADATGMMGVHPSLRGAVERLTREGVEVAIRNGRDTTPPMPAFGGRLSDTQIEDVIAYIDSLPEGPRNFGAGEEMMGDGDMMDQMGDGDMMDGGMMGGFMVLWVLLVLALIAVAVAAAVWLVRNMGGPRRDGGSPGGQSAARAELDRRYAAGELSRDEYLERRGDLET